MGPLLIFSLIILAIAFFLSGPLKELIRGRNQRKLLQQQHQHRIELLKQLNELASTELLSGEFGKSDAAGKLRERITSEMDASLESLVRTETRPDPAPLSDRPRY